MSAQLIRFPTERRIPRGQSVTMVLRILRQQLRLEDEKKKPKSFLHKALDALR